MRDLTDEEDAVLRLLGEAAGRFGALPPSHPSDVSEFVLAIHAAQNIVMARPAAEFFSAGKEGVQ